MSSTTFATLQCAASRIVAKEQETPTANTPMTPRCHVLHLGVMVGDLCSALLKHAPLDPKRGPLEDMNGPVHESSTDSCIWNPSTPEQEQRRSEIAQAMGRLLWAFVVASEACSMDLYICIVKKLELNERKYPVELCKGKSGKYTAYSEHTGITKTEGQSTLLHDMVESSETTTVTVESVICLIRTFATERLWSRFHTPRSLALALMGELGELAELFQWKGDDSDKMKLEGWAQEDVDHVGQELADVTIYLLRLADVCGIYDIGDRALRASDETE